MNDQGPEINLRIAALIPDDFVPDINQRLSLYKRISQATDEQQLKDLQIEMIDRFGLLPQQVKNLFEQQALKQSIAHLGIKKIDMGEQSGNIEFSKETQIDPFTLVQLIQAMPQQFKLQKGDQLKFFVSSNSPEERFSRLNELLIDK